MQVPFRLSPDEAARLSSAAERAGLTREAYIRQKLFSGPPLARDVSGALFELTCRINTVSTAVMQTARAALSSGVDEQHINMLLEALETTEDSLRDLRACIVRPPAGEG